MSNETKNKTAAETVAENVQAIAEATAAGAASAEEVATAAAEVAAVPTKFGKGKQAKPKAERAIMFQSIDIFLLQISPNHTQMLT